MSQTAQLAQLLSARRTLSGIFEDRTELWSEVGVAPAAGSHSFAWTRSPVPNGGEIFERLPRSVKSLVLIGMGGATSSTEAYACVLPTTRRLHVLNSTSPESLADFFSKPPAPDAHYVIASKSGTTLETLSIAKAVFEHVDSANAFTAITDPSDSQLRSWAAQNQIKTYCSDPYVPGRFSALSNLALIPTAMLGIDIAKIHAVREEFSRLMTTECETTDQLRTLAAELARASVTRGARLEIRTALQTLPFARWLEQLSAESLGKCGLGVLPVITTIDGPRQRDGEKQIEIDIVIKESHFGIRYSESDLTRNLMADIFLKWQCVITLVGYLIGIDPYNQPEVERAKRFGIASAGQNQAVHDKVPTSPYRYVLDMKSDQAIGRVKDFFSRLQNSLRPHDYVALLAYVNPTRDNEAELEKLALLLKSRFQLHQNLVVYSFGPQYLHSTGQFHKSVAKAALMSTCHAMLRDIRRQKTQAEPDEGVKNDRIELEGSGHFLFIEAEERCDFEVVGCPYTFAFVVREQARLDAQYLALADRFAGTSPSLIKLSGDTESSLHRLRAALHGVEWIV